MTDGKAPAKEASAARAEGERSEVLMTCHASDCAMHNMPAEPNGPCDCGYFLSDAALARMATIINDVPSEYANAMARELQSRRSAAPGREESGAILPTASEASMNKEEAGDIVSLLRLYGPRSTIPELVRRGVAEIERVSADKDAAYEERNRLVALLASLFPSGIARTDIPGWLPEWHGCVYIDLPCGQASWHYHDSQGHLFAHLPPYTKPWDGHTTEQKYDRIAALTIGAVPLACSPAPLHAGRGESDAI